jgi:hypothetical protein
MVNLACSGQAWLGGIGAVFSAQVIAGAIIGLLWAMALWQSWECRGPFADGSN